MISLAERTPLHVPDVHSVEIDGITYAIDAEAPNWIAIEARGVELFQEIRDAERGGSPLTLGAAVARYASRHEIPVDSRSVDLVTSNCVVNLSPDKPRVFAEMWRVLRDQGRILISDIVSEGAVPPHLKVNPRLWGECPVGALTQEEFSAALEPGEERTGYACCGAEGCCQ